jgi:DNA-binding LacI/PurR family transcriptional regulator
MGAVDGASLPDRTNRPRAVSMADVAAVAEVSEMTVSRVVNGGRRVHPTTRRRVVEAMEALGYRPNLAARSLATGKSGVLGVVVFDTFLFGHASTLAAIEEAAAVARYYVTIASLRGIPSEEVIRAAIDRLSAQSVEGILVVGPGRVTAEVIGGLKSDVPIVMMERCSSGRHAGVGVDQETGSAAAVRYLLSLGHETVAHVMGPTESLATWQREAAWREALLAAGRAVPAPPRGDWSARSGYQVARALAARHDETAMGS